VKTVDFPAGAGIERKRCFGALVASVKLAR